MVILCPKCNGALPEWFLRTSRVESLCPTCYTELTIELFPALFRESDVIDPTRLPAAEGEASCYEHIGKRAVSLCSQCGRFLCALCEVDIRGEIWCPACLQANKARPKLRSLETQRTLYDSIALALGTLPVLLFFYPSVVTAPIVIYLAIRHWKTPSSLVPRNKWRFLAAIAFALLQLCLFAVFIFALVTTGGKKVLE